MPTEEDAIPSMEHPQIFVERTLAIVKPDAVNRCEEIEDIIFRSGFSVLQVNSTLFLRCTVTCMLSDFLVYL